MSLHRWTHTAILNVQWYFGFFFTLDRFFSVCVLVPTQTAGGIGREVNEKLRWRRCRCRLRSWDTTPHPSSSSS